MKLTIGEQYTTHKFYNDITSLVIKGTDVSNCKYFCDYYKDGVYHESGSFRTQGDFAHSLALFNPLKNYFMLKVLGGNEPTKKHRTIEAAKDECARLMRSNNHIEEIEITQVKVIGKAVKPMMIAFEMNK